VNGNNTILGGAGGFAGREMTSQRPRTRTVDQRVNSFSSTEVNPLLIRCST